MDKLKQFIPQGSVSRGRTIVLTALLFMSTAALLMGIMGVILRRPKKKYLYYVGFGFGFWVVLLAVFFFQYKRRHTPPAHVYIPPPTTTYPGPGPYQPAYNAYGQPMPQGPPVHPAPAYYG
ncbi:hypothetical protein IWQ61_005027 [Dispira simplex]|nr:hypothetical protein IWQ61_005027 [Dispira simplex]